MNLLNIIKTVLASDVFAAVAVVMFFVLIGAGIRELMRETKNR